MRNAYRWLAAGVVVMALLVGASKARGAAVEVVAMPTYAEAASGELAESQWGSPVQTPLLQAVDVNRVPSVGTVLISAVLLAAFSMAVLPIGVGLISIRADAKSSRR